MTNNSPLDEHIKGKFGNYTPDVPPHIWGNIIAEKEKRRPAGFWFSFLNKNMLLLLLVIVTAGAGIIIYKNIFFEGDNNQIRLFQFKLFTFGEKWIFHNEADMAIIRVVIRDTNLIQRACKMLFI